MNIHQIYIEKDLQTDPKVELILKKYPQSTIVYIEKYQEVFNRNKQNFRLQKETPCLILAKKYGKFIHSIPEEFGIGFDHHYYFSTTINCPFDCRYCFLQGLNKSSHYVIFINDLDFKSAISAEIAKNPHQTYAFFSGYDADSLALDSLSNFTYEYLPFFEQFSNAICEVRTKSVMIRPLLELKTIQNTLVAYTLNPQEIIERDEKKTPFLKARLQAIQKLQQAGYKIALRFDPMMVIENALSIYQQFFQQVFQEIDPNGIHSVTIGSFRLPKSVFQNYVKIDPYDFRLALLEETSSQEFSYPKEIVEKLLDLAFEQISSKVPTNKIFTMQKL
jgi:spore photoproduct lyase